MLRIKTMLWNVYIIINIKKVGGKEAERKHLSFLKQFYTKHIVDNYKAQLKINRNYANWLIICIPAIFLRCVWASNAGLPIECNVLVW